MSQDMDPAEVLEVEEIARYRIINETIAHGDSRLQQFYAGAVVLVTGGSGFLGKQLIEKLLRSAKIKKIYILLRHKKNRSIEQRIEKLFADPVYEVLRKTQPNFTEKIIPVTADISEVNLAIQEEDWKRITEEVTIIFHGAATISFTEPLRVATLINVRGTTEMIKLARACKNLKSFVHISTAYAHATYEHVEQVLMEKFYKSPITPELLLQLVDTTRDEQLDILTAKLIANWPNTYSFTKAVAEEALRKMAGDLPICIVRPAIVIGAKCEPIPGWIDRSCVFGASGIVVGCAVGIVHTIHATGDSKLDLVPVDIVNNAVIAAAHATVTRRERGETDILIYHVTGSRDPLTMGKMINNIEIAGDMIATPKSVWLGFVWRTRNRFLYFLLCWLLHYIPGYLVDGILKMMGKKPMLLDVYNKMYKLNGVLAYYMNNEWSFDDSNLRKLFWGLSPADRTIYNCNMIPMDWRHFVLIWCLGCRKYIIQDGLKNTASGVRKRILFRILNVVVVFIYSYILYFVLYNACYFVRYLIHLI